MANNTIRRSWNMYSMVNIEDLRGNAFQDENKGHTFEITGTDGNGNTVPLSGTVSAIFLRADNTDVAITGTISGGIASITLPEECYDMPGRFGLTIYLTTGTYKTAIYAAIGSVHKTSSGTVSPGTAENVEDLIDAINAAVASIPLDYSEMTNIVRPFDNDMISMLSYPLFEQDQLSENALSGTMTDGKAWNINGSPVSGGDYVYTTFNTSGLTANDYIVVDGHSWGANYPLVSLYDSSNNLVKTFYTAGNTSYKARVMKLGVVSAYAIVNGRKTAPINYPRVIAYTAAGIQHLISNPVRSHFQRMNASVVSEDSSLAYLRNWPANRIYAISDDSVSSFLDLPVGLTRYATVLKFAPNYDLVTSKGYCGYLITSEQNCWLGFDNGSRIIWNPINRASVFNDTYLMIGDSYAEGYSHDGNNDGWELLLANELGLSSEKYVRSYHGGDGFANGGFLSQLNNAPVKDYSAIIVCGGFNERNNTYEEIIAAIGTFCARARALFPNATIHIGCIGHIKEGTGESAYSNWQQIETKIETVVLPAYQRCTRSGALYMNFAEYLLGDSGLTPTDGYHPSEAGNREIAKGIANAFLTGTCTLPFKSSLRSE